MEFKSRAVRNLSALHERELRAFLVVWRRFLESGKPMPDAHGDPNYRTRDHLGAHVLMAARGYLCWIGEMVGRDVTDIDRTKDVQVVASRASEFADEVLSAWTRHLAAFSDEEITPAVYTSAWGERFTIEQMLEHAVVHPMRHRVQLERILDGLE